MARDELIESVLSELHAVDSKMKIVSQRLSIIERNEKILGKTLITHNKRIKELEERIARLEVAAPEKAPVKGGDFESSLKQLKEQLEKVEEMISKLQDEINELKYVVEMINPLAYATIDKVEEIVEERIEKLKKEMGKG